MRRYRRGRISFYTILGIAILVVGGGWGVTFAPMYWDYYNMKQIAKDVALDWRQNGGVSKADIARTEERLRVEMGYKNLTDMFNEKSCKVRASKVSLERSIDCVWQVYTSYPIIDHEVAREFIVTVIIDRNDDIIESSDVIDLYEEAVAE